MIGDFIEARIHCGGKERESMSFWVVYLKDGRCLSFDKKAHWIQNDGGIVWVKTSSVGNFLAAIPLNNILWIESVAVPEETEE